MSSLGVVARCLNSPWRKNVYIIYIYIFVYRLATHVVCICRIRSMFGLTFWFDNRVFAIVLGHMSSKKIASCILMLSHASVPNWSDWQVRFKSLPLPFLCHKKSWESDALQVMAEGLFNDDPWGGEHQAAAHLALIGFCDSWWFLLVAFEWNAEMQVKKDKPW